jgi:benzoyl-CoA reductase/2-hydroxyglutaryl-CoA dehydratase subunit BcrC/BadD/HgdB
MHTTLSSEKGLKELTTLGLEANRAKYALQWKKDGKKVAGLLCSYIPEELVHAAGVLPWRVFGTWQAGTPHANEWRPADTCLYCNHVLEALLTDRLEFLDAVVATDWDQELVRLWDVWRYVNKTPATIIIDVPIINADTAVKFLTQQFNKFIGEMEKLSGRAITDDDLKRSIDVLERTRHLVKRLYEMRNTEIPSLTGTEMLGITTASMLMPKEEFNERVEALLPFLEKRKVPAERSRPRLLVSSDRLDNPGHLAAIEEAGCFVAMDDLDTGSRHYWRHVEVGSASSPAWRQEMVSALARRYLMQPASPRMLNWEDQVDQVIHWVRDYNIQGVIELPQGFSRYREFRANYFKSRLEEAGIPVMSYRREYIVSNVGQMKTRVGAFIEMIESKA